MLTALLPSLALAQGIPITNMSPAFHPGPYASLYVDPSNPDVIGIGTVDGHVLYSSDGGVTSREDLVMPMRNYHVMVLRGNPRFPRYVRPRPGRGGTRLFIAVLRAGGIPTRWAVWMSMEDPLTDLIGIAMQPGNKGRMLAVGPSGVHLSDRQKGVWTRTVGGNRPKSNDVVGYSVGIDPSNPKHVLAGTDKGLMVSDDGGFTFLPHPDPNLGPDDPATGIQFDLNDPKQVLVTTSYSVYQSSDGGKSFQAAFGSQGIINSVVLTQEGAYIATGEGLYVSGADGAVNLTFKERNVVGAIPLGEGSALVATDTDLYIVARDGTKVALMHTSMLDPFQRLGGTAQTAWLLSKYSIHRVGAPPERRRASEAERRYPKVRVGLKALEKAVDRHLGLIPPSEAKLSDRWYAKLLPVLSVELANEIEGQDLVVFDGTFPINYRQRRASTASKFPQLFVWAHWDLGQFIFGEYSNVSNPFAFLESRLKPIRGEILNEVRWRYREAVQLVKLLKNPPVDPVVDLNWRMRLEEHTAYLEALAGRNVISLDQKED
jgi:hypothetical protein